MKLQHVVAATCLVAIATVLAANSARPASPASGLIAFTRSDGIYVMRADGSAVRPLWRGGAPTDVAWSPDGSKLAFGTWGGRVRAMNADGSGVVHIAKVLARSLTWSANGRKVAFTRWYKGVGADIWVMDADGSHMRRLARTQAWNVSWSPAGGRIAFDSGGYFPEVYLMRTDASNPRRITSGCAHQPDFSPDGRKIVFVDCQHQIWVMNTDGRSRARLTPYEVGEAQPEWSPDGCKIAFLRNDEIYVMNADGSGVRRLTHNRVAEWSPAWQPVAPAQG